MPFYDLLSDTRSFGIKQDILRGIKKDTGKNNGKARKQCLKKRELKRRE